jgi:hypothetical protein
MNFSSGHVTGLLSFQNFSKKVVLFLRFNALLSISNNFCFGEKQKVYFAHVSGLFYIYA